MNDPIKRIRKPPNFDEAAFSILISDLYKSCDIQNADQRAEHLEQTYNLKDYDAKLK